ncbi:MAG TPA: carboxypeptidase-like regulatory domain-containing protein [Patescibacteria group bacterium]|nr:carboxypeptidase-like regulatory domain-containing protein [Patescibacteria group bacterium]
MHARGAKIAFAWGFLALLFLVPIPSRAQSAGATVSGTVTGATGKPVPGAQVSVRNLTTGQSRQAQTSAAGSYNLSNLAPGEYEISASAVALNTQTEKLTLGAGAKQTMNFALTAELSLQDLGFSASQTQGNAREQALLNKRSHMLQVHQKLGLITAFPMIATVVTSFGAHGRHSTGASASRDLHIGLGSATAGLYAATAYYAIFAPKVAGVKARGPIRFHKAMAWIHGPGMILTPILGAMAESQLNQGEKLHGIAKYHGDVALVTAVAYGLALLSETKPNWIPGLGHHVASAFGFHHRAAANASAAYPARVGGAEIAKNGNPAGE